MLGVGNGAVPDASTAVDGRVAPVRCARHSDDDVDATVEAFDTGFGTMATRDDVRPLLTGPPVEPVFR